MFVSGFKDAAWHFDLATQILTDWFQSEGFSVQSVECCDVNERDQPLTHAYFGFVRLASLEQAARAISQLNGEKVLGRKMVVRYQQEGPEAAPSDPAVATQVSCSLLRSLQNSYRIAFSSLHTAWLTHLVTLPVSPQISQLLCHSVQHPLPTHSSTHPLAQSQYPKSPHVPHTHILCLSVCLLVSLSPCNVLSKCLLCLQFDGTKPCSRKNPMIIQLASNLAPAGAAQQELQQFISRHAFGAQARHHCEEAKELRSYSQQNQVAACACMLMFLATDTSKFAEQTLIVPSICQAAGPCKMVDSCCSLEVA